GRPSLKVSAGSGGQPARLDVWSCAAAKGYDGRKRICRACGAQSRATSSVRTKRGRRVKRGQSPTPIQFRSRPRASLTLLMRLEGSQCDWQIRPCLNSTQSYGGRGAKKARSDRRLYQDL